MIVFSFVKCEDADRISECGIKTSEYGTVSARMNGTEKPCIQAFLSPYDSGLVNDSKYTVIKIDMDPKDVTVGEYIYYMAGDRDSFERSFIRLSDYQLGTYRRPVCLISESIFEESIERYDSRMDEPVLFGNSEDLYVDKIFSTLADEDQNFKEIALNAYFEKKSDDIKKIGDYKEFYADKKVIFAGKETVLQ